MPAAFLEKRYVRVHGDPRHSERCRKAAPDDVPDRPTGTGIGRVVADEERRVVDGRLSEGDSDGRGARSVLTEEEQKSKKDNHDRVAVELRVDATTLTGIGKRASVLFASI